MCVCVLGGCLCLHRKIFFDSYSSETAQSVINISRDSEKKQTIKPVSHTKIWK